MKALKHELFMPVHYSRVGGPDWRRIMREGGHLLYSSFDSRIASIHWSDGEPDLVNSCGPGNMETRWRT